MIRRPRFPLTLRLGWMEAELAHAAKLMGLFAADMIELKGRLAENEEKIVIVANVAMAALMPIGVDADLVDDFLRELGPAGDVDEADDLGVMIVGQILLLLTPGREGEGH